MTSLSRRQFAAPSADTGVQYPDHLLDRVVARVAPFFFDGETLTDSQSRDVARQLISNYRAVTGKELQLAAQISALGIAVLICLSAASERGLPVETMLRITDNAIKLSNLSNKTSKALDARQQERRRGQSASPEAAQLDEAEFNATIGKARDFVTFARTNVEAVRVARELSSTDGASTGQAPAAPAAEPAIATRRLPPLIAEEMTASVLDRRKNADRSWAKELGKLSDLKGVTRH